MPRMYVHTANTDPAERKSKKIERALEIARQLRASGSHITLAALARRVGTSGEVVRKALEDAGLNDVLNSTAGW